MNGEVWKTLTVALAAFVTGILLAGIPFVLRSATQEQIEQVEQRQVLLLERQATLSAQVAFLQDQASQLMDALEQLERDHQIPPDGG